jgi:hypothetical protein
MKDFQNVTPYISVTQNALVFISVICSKAYWIRISYKRAYVRFYRLGCTVM